MSKLSEEFLEEFRAEWLKILPNESKEDAVERVCIGMMDAFTNHLIDSISDGDIEIKYKDVVMMPKNNFQGTYNLNMPDNEHKREGAKWFKQTLKDKLNDL